VRTPHTEKSSKPNSGRQGLFNLFLWASADGGANLGLKLIARRALGLREMRAQRVGDLKPKHKTVLAFGRDNNTLNNKHDYLFGFAKVDGFQRLTKFDLHIFNLPTKID
jgi:hypothetical protein